MAFGRAVAAMTIGALLACCGTTNNGSASLSSAVGSASRGNPTGTAGGLSGELTVFAAASLQQAFDRIAREFVAANPGVILRPITYDGSATLAVQLMNGATADVFAAADDATMRTIVDAGLASEPVRFASNSLQIVVQAGNPAGITGLADLAAPGLDVVLCGAPVPCGDAARKALTAAGVAVDPVSEEQSVNAVLVKVISGDADAGLVYRTDVAGAPPGTVSGVEFPESAQAVNNYPIVILREAADPAVASAFRDFVAAGPGQQVLADLGFMKPQA